MSVRYTFTIAASLVAALSGCYFGPYPSPYYGSPAPGAYYGQPGMGSGGYAAPGGGYIVPGDGTYVPNGSGATPTPISPGGNNPPPTWRPDANAAPYDPATTGSPLDRPVPRPDTDEGFQTPFNSSGMLENQGERVAARPLPGAPKASPITPVAAQVIDGIMYSRAPNFSRLQGRLDYDELDRSYSLIYDLNPGPGDPNGGSVTLAPNPNLGSLPSGAAVSVEGYFGEGKDAIGKSLYYLTGPPVPQAQ